jgi:hypothetical protein
MVGRVRFTVHRINLTTVYEGLKSKVVLISRNRSCGPEAASPSVAGRLSRGSRPEDHKRSE